jgi:hypothetical protein
MSDITILPPEKKLVDTLNAGMAGDFSDFDAMKELKTLILHDLIDRLKSGTMTHQEMAVAVRILKDNGMTLMPYSPEPTAPPREPIGFPINKTVSLPSFDDAEDGEELED